MGMKLVIRQDGTKSLEPFTPAEQAARDQTIADAPAQLKRFRIIKVKEVARAKRLGVASEEAQHRAARLLAVTTNKRAQGAALAPADQAAEAAALALMAKLEAISQREQELLDALNAGTLVSRKDIQAGSILGVGAWPT